MRLNHDCVRAILLYAEEHLDNKNCLDSENWKLFSKEKGFSLSDIHYSLEKLIEAGYVNGSIEFADGTFNHTLVAALTWEGHAFLDNIRDDKVWAFVKSNVKNFASASLPFIAQYSFEYLKQLFLPK